MAQADSGYFANGLPYNRLGNGPRTLVVFTGLAFENKPMAGMELRASRGAVQFLEQDYTVWVVNRRPGLRRGATIADMADDYAETIRSEFSGPVDVMGISSGGSIALQFALDHPDLIRHLVIYSAASRLGEVGRTLQRELSALAARRRWGDAFSMLMSFLFLPRSGIGRTLTRPVRGAFYVMGRLVVRVEDPSDVVVTVSAEDSFDVGDRLGEIRVPTLVVAGANDPFYERELFEATASGIPGARLHLESDGGHVPTGEGVRSAIRTFLDEPAPQSSTVVP